MNKVIEEIVSEKIQEIIADKIAEENTETIIIGVIVMIEAGISLEKGHFPEVMTIIELRVQAIVDQGQDLEQVKNRDRIRCYKCRGYDHFMRDCPTSREEREIEQLQHMLNLEEDQTCLLRNS